ncbi:hypothetical protein [Sphingomicrobium nitratireducens]|uniref:hypothetical protein n=1 Tax=Sphingomicrobium nitratireducens TaxID=2964666 RepID=UPI00223FCF5C|nr:hypothetical protein [Sphingomicrobium nitratireducens]
MSHILWSLATVVGVIVLALVMLHVIRKNKASDVPIERTERATRELYEEADQKDGAA